MVRAKVYGLIGIMMGLLGGIQARAEATLAYYHTDHLGSVRMITDSQGAVISVHDYLPYGEDTTPTPNNRLKFTGQLRDHESGLDYFGARYYANTYGRFLSPDPKPLAKKVLANPQDLNLYTYTINNPLRYVDPDGADWLAALLLGPEYKDVSTFRTIFSKETIRETKQGAQTFASDHQRMFHGLSPVPTQPSEVPFAALGAFGGGLKKVTALDTNVLVQLEKLGGKALEGITGRLVVSRTAFAELVKGSGLEKANELLTKFGIEKFFGVKNVAAFENTLEQGLKLGLTTKDARILAEARAVAGKISTDDKALMEAAKKLGVDVARK